MNIYEDLKYRGIVAQTTNESKVKELLNNSSITFYIGFEPTASSLHVGHFVQILLMSRLQKSGHSPICLFGGGTGFVGDPSGKNDMRPMMSKEEISYNVECFKKQSSRFLDISTVRFVNNADWLCNLNYIDFLREVGTCFSVNKMLAAECYKQRLDTGLTFFELNYMIMQGFDFYYLYKKYNCQMQIGGNDQWSNIISGVELVRKKMQKEVFGMTTNLLTKSDGKKMGKTENGAIWLDPDKTSPYEFYQYWRNVKDEDVIKCLKMLTSLDIEEIKELELLKGQDINKAKKILSYNLTELVHGKSEADKAEKSSTDIFVSGNSDVDIPVRQLQKLDFVDNKIKIIDVLFKSKITSSKSEARRLIEQGGISINGKLMSLDSELSINDFKDGLVLQKGKKTYIKIMRI